MKFQSYLLIVLLSMYSFSALSQESVPERAKDKADQKANSRIDNKVDQGLDKGFDAIEGLFKKKKKKTKIKSTSQESSSSESVMDGAGSADESVIEEAPEEVPEIEETESPREKKNEYTNMYSKMMGGLFEPAEWENSYSFDIVSEATWTSKDSKGRVEKGQIKYLAGDDAFCMRMDQENEDNGEGFVVFDLKNNSFITLSEEDGEKKGMAIAMNDEQKNISSRESYETSEEDFPEVTFRKTGRTKMIAGFLSDEYEGEGEGGEGTMWTSMVVKIDTEKMFALFGSSKEQKSMHPDYYPEGYLMEAHFFDHEEKEESHYVVTRLETDASERLDLSAYEVRGFKQMMEEGK